MSKREYNWCFTLNNPEYSPRLVDEYQYLCYQLEVGEEGTQHYQGYVELKKALRMVGMKKLLPGAHLEPRRGSQAQAIAYCKKEDTRVEGPFEFGLPKEQGKRNDLVALVDMARQGKRKREASEEMPATYARYHRAYEHIASLYEPALTKDREVVLLWGATGAGKTRYVKENYPGAYFVPLSKDMWFNGYDGQEVVCLDDFAGQFPLCLLLRLLDRYVCQVPTKGGFVWWTPTTIVVTSNFPLDSWYEWKGREEHQAALHRRFKEERYLGPNRVHGPQDRLN